jgi:hypothetical protein
MAAHQQTRSVPGRGPGKLKRLSQAKPNRYDSLKLCR